MRNDSGFKQFASRLHRLVSGSEEADDFDALALALFELQFEHNPAYRKLCAARRVSPETVEHWSRVPAVPTASFKDLEFSCLPAAQRTHVFHSSGTTEQRPSRHFHNADSLTIYESSLLSWFHSCCLSRFPVNGFSDRTVYRHAPDKPLDLLVLTPSPEEAPHSSLAFMFDCIRRALGAPHSAFVGRVEGDNSWTLDLERATDILSRSCQEQQPALILGTAFSFVHLLDYMMAEGLRYKLPSGSLLMETGGYKGRSRELAKDQLYSLINQCLGVIEVIAEYGMSELSSQAYAAQSAVAPEAQPNALRQPGPFLFPPWAKAQIISPENGREVDDGQTGLVRVVDLANVYSVMAIQTEDLAIRRAQGFELLGRASLAEARGCSLLCT